MTSYVLIHGAWSGAFRWKAVRPLLAAAGHQVYTPSLTGLGDRVHLARPDTDLDTHIADVVNVIEFEDLRDVVLVGHSYGGMPVTGAADRVPERIKHLIYVDAFQPRDGDSCWSLGGAGNSLKEGEWLVQPSQATVSPNDPQVKRVAQPVLTLSQPLRLSMPLEKQPFSRTYVKATADAHPEPPGRSHFWEVADHVQKDPAWRYVGSPAGHGIPWLDPTGLTKLLLEYA